MTYLANNSIGPLGSSDDPIGRLVRLRASGWSATAIEAAPSTTTNKYLCTLSIINERMFERVSCCYVQVNNCNIHNRGNGDHFLFFPSSLPPPPPPPPPRQRLSNCRGVWERGHKWRQQCRWWWRPLAWHSCPPRLMPAPQQLWDGSDPSALLRSCRDSCMQSLHLSVGRPDWANMKLATWQLLFLFTNNVFASNHISFWSPSCSWRNIKWWGEVKLWPLQSVWQAIVFNTSSP